MDAVITKARELGKAIQADARYDAYVQATVANEGDLDLQKLIAEFEISRKALNTEIQKEEKDTERIKELDAKVKGSYNEIFASPTMIAFNDARGDLEDLLSFVNQIITGSSNGQNPDTIEQAADCGNSCSSCAGCS